MVELAIFLPLMLYVFAALLVDFDLFYQHATNHKANYVISNMISRETEALDDTYIDNAANLFRMLNGTEQDEETTDTTASAFSADDAFTTPIYASARCNTILMTAGKLPRSKAGATKQRRLTAICYRYHRKLTRHVRRPTPDHRPKLGNRHPTHRNRHR